MVAFWPSSPVSEFCSSPATMAKKRSIEQNLFDLYYPRIGVNRIGESDISPEILDEFLAGSQLTRSIGISAAFDSKGKLAVLAVALAAKVLLIESKGSANDTISEARTLLQDRILCSNDNVIYAFDIAPIALALFVDQHLRLVNGVDFQTVPGNPDTNRDQIAAIKFITAGSNATIHPKNIRALFDDSTWDPENRNCETFLALRAWTAAYLSTFNGDAENRFRDAKRVNTMVLSDTDLFVLAKQSRGEHRLDSEKISSTQHGFMHPMIKGKDGQKAVFPLADFQSRILSSQVRTKVRLHIRNERDEESELYGRIVEVSGRRATVRLDHPHNFYSKTILSLISTGSGGTTLADLGKTEEVLKILWGGSLASNPFLQTIWPTPGQEVEWPSTFKPVQAVPIILPSDKTVNDSQEEAITHMLEQTNDKRITIIQGPPGTGKTTVIAAFVLSAVTSGQGGIWLIAQSNVAVKNIAEKLNNIGFDNWKLLVSKDFKIEWHDELYSVISKHVIVSENFKYADNYLKNCQVILCTLSMLSHPSLWRFTKRVPIISLVVDEASQINVSQYIHPISHFSTLRKLCFIGDDKQLPPYGQEQIDEIESIFEISHLRTRALFLDIQYRMPSQIGNFISDAVYDGQLRSNPSHPLANDLCAFFVHVPDSTELPHGTSYYNPTEIKAILKMATRLQEDNESFKIITPYVAQKTMLETALKEAGLHYHNKCFAVDSFQGNEEDIIVLSLVRTSQLGFLNDLRRTNVMLTRCKKNMFVVSSWDFLVNGFGSQSLVGRMAACLGDDSWIWPDDLAIGNW